MLDRKEELQAARERKRQQAQEQINLALSDLAKVRGDDCDLDEGSMEWVEANLLSEIKNHLDKANSLISLII